MRISTWLLGAALLMPAPAAAETLREAMASAYATNPELAAARAGVRISDEDLVQARAEVRPSLGGQALLDQETTNPGDFTDRSRLVAGTIRLTQPIYRGGVTIAGIRAADRRVLSGREELRQTENDVLLDAVIVYMDVLRDQSEVELTENNVLVLERQLQASQDRFEVGDITRTDVAQSEARLALARSQNIAAQGNLEVSRNAYERVVGHPPENLQPPPPLPTLPASMKQAVDLALQESPSIISARLQEEAASFDVRAARGARLPQLDATFDVGYTNFRGNVGGGVVRAASVDYTQNIGLTATIPLYQKGQAGSRIRQASARAGQLRHQALNTERFVIEGVRSAYENLLTARATIEAANIGVSSNTLALEGVRAENSVGNRTILDVLDAEQELLSAQVQLVRAERNAYVAGYALLNAIGSVEAETLSLPVDLYAPEIYLKRANGRIFDWAAEFTPQPLTTNVAAETPPPTVVPPLPDETEGSREPDYGVTRD